MALAGDPALLAVLCAALERARRQAASLVIARTVELPGARDPLELYARAEELGETRFAATCARSGVTRIGVGEVEVLRPCASGSEVGAGIARLATEAQALLDSADTAPGGDLLLMGGFAFDPHTAGAGDPAWRAFGPGRLTLPEWTLVSGPEGSRLTWAVKLAPGDDADALALRFEKRRARLLAPQGRRPGWPRLAPPPDALSARYTPAARELIEAIRSGAAQKVVLAGSESLQLEGQLAAPLALSALRAAHPDCLVFAQGLGDATFLGATPERMVALSEGRVCASALAGTAAVGCDLLGSAKDRAEHAFVVEAIAETLRATCDDVEVPAEPDVLTTGRFAHLQTELTARARPGLHVLDLVAKLHPTPAVAGTPRGAALELIRKHEPFDRGWYAGPIGWVGAGGGEFHVALRCGLLRPGELRVFAGAGLVAASDPVSEAAETRLKLGALREPLEAACAR